MFYKTSSDTQQVPRLKWVGKFSIPPEFYLCFWLASLAIQRTFFTPVKYKNLKGARMIHCTHPLEIFIVQRRYSQLLYCVAFIRGFQDSLGLSKGCKIIIILTACTCFTRLKVPSLHFNAFPTTISLLFRASSWYLLIFSESPGWIKPFSHYSLLLTDLFVTTPFSLSSHHLHFFHCIICTLFIIPLYPVISRNYIKFPLPNHLAVA